MSEDQEGSAERPSAIRRLVTGQADFDFVRPWRIAVVVSAVLVIASIASLGFRGLNRGIDFEGGTSWEYISDQSVATVRDVLTPVGEGSAKIQIVTDESTGTARVRAQSDLTEPAQVEVVANTLAESVGLPPSEITINFVGPSWGDEISDAARSALIWFFVVISIYISVRLEWKMAIGALVATTHDIVITIGVYSIFWFEVTPATVIAVLTILGYSLYDTIVVFDRAQENSARYLNTGRFSYTDLMNRSLNQVLIRSVNTTVISLLPVISMLVVGALLLGVRPLQEFAIALIVGLVVGGYSSIFIAAPAVAAMKEREPRWAQIRNRLENREATIGLDSEVDDASARRVRTIAAMDEVEAASLFGHQPRGRKGKPGRKR